MSSAEQTRAPSSHVGREQAGDQIGGYRLVAPIAVGGMGSVWVAQDERRGARVALKLLRIDRIDEHLLNRFQREADLLRGLDCPHVAKMLDAGLERGRPFIALELLEGEPLSSVIKRDAPLPIDRAANLLLQACAGVAAAHVKKIVHRDLKPSNLFLTRDGDGAEVLKVLDFGIAKAVGGAVDGESLTETDVTLGTPGYLAPEQLRSTKHADHRADVWALGMIFFKMLTGAAAFPGDTAGEYFAQILSHAPVRLRSLRPDAPAELELVILRCLEKDPSVRLPDVARLAFQVGRFAHERYRPLVKSVCEMLGVDPSRDPPEAPTAALDADTTRDAPAMGRHHDDDPTRQDPSVGFAISPAPRARAPATRRGMWIVAAAFSALVGAAGGGLTLWSHWLGDGATNAREPSSTAEPVQVTIAPPDPLPSGSALQAGASASAEAPTPSAEPSARRTSSPSLGKKSAAPRPVGGPGQPAASTTSSKKGPLEPTL